MFNLNYRINLRGNSPIPLSSIKGKKTEKIMKFGKQAARANKPANLKKQAGLTLVELSIALAIGAVITIVGVIFAGDALKESRISSEAARINSIVMKSRAAFANTSYSNIAEDASIAAARLGVFPKDMINTPNQDPAQVTTVDEIKNRWGGTVTFGKDAPGSVFRLVYPNIPQDDCVELVNRVESLFTHIHGAVTTAPVTASTIKRIDGATPIPFNIGELVTSGCNEATNVLTFAYRK